MAALAASAAALAAGVRIAVTVLLVALTVATLGSTTTWPGYIAVTVLASSLFAATAAALAVPVAGLGFTHAKEGPSRPGTSRRDLLLRLPVFALGGGALVLVARQVLKASGGGAQASHAGQETPEVTSNKDYYLVSKNLLDPDVNEKSWTLRVGGLVPKMLQFGYQDILALPAIDQYTTMQCISNEVGGDLFSNALWRGIPLRDFIAVAQPAATAQYIAFRCADDYTESLPLSFAMQEGLLLAHTMNGEALPSKHGFPLRLLSPGKYGMKHPKWIVEIAFFQDEFFGYWEQRGWSQENRMNTSCRIDVPARGTVIRDTKYRISGVAFAGNRGIGKVEVSVDGGQTWSEAVMKPPLSAYTWVLWHYDWTGITTDGRVRIVARTTDGTGELQTSENAPPYPSGAAGYPAVSASVRLAM